MDLNPILRSGGILRLKESLLRDILILMWSDWRLKF